MNKTKFLFIFALIIILSSFSPAEATTQTKPSQSQASQSAKSDAFNLRNFISTNFGNTNKYFLELIVGIFLVTYTINYLLGKSTNEKYAQLWVKENKEVFQKHFTEVGAVGSEGDNILEAEAANYFKFYASGRRNCSYARVLIELKKRHNIVSMVIFNLIWPEKDRVRVDIPIKLSSALPFILAVVRKKEAKHVQKNYPDIKALCQTMTFDELQRYIVLAEHEETAEFILTDRLVATLKKYHNIIEMISFTDMNAPHKQVLRADMVMPQSVLRNPKEFHEILETLFSLVDHVVQYKMSPGCRKKAEKERELYQRNSQKAERSQPKEKAESSKKKDENKEEPRRKLQKKFVKLN